MSHSARRREALVELQDNKHTSDIEMCLSKEAQKTWNLKRKFL